MPFPIVDKAPRPTLVAVHPDDELEQPHGGVAEDQGEDDAGDRVANGELDAPTADAAQSTRALVEYLRPFSREAVVTLIRQHE